MGVGEEAVRNYDKASDEVTVPIRHGFPGRECPCSICTSIGQFTRQEIDLGTKRMEWEGNSHERG